MPENMDRAEKGEIWKVDLWAPYRGRYPEPTSRELYLISSFLYPFDFEKDDFVEGDEWRSLGEEVGIQNLRALLLEFLHQVRESKGYDVVDERFGLFNSPFMPLKVSDTQTYDRMMAAANLAIATINAETREHWKIYELVAVEKLVRTRNRMLLLTLSVKELDAEVTMVDADDVDAAKEVDAAVVMKTIRAMVFDPVEGMELKEWKFKT